MSERLTNDTTMVINELEFILPPTLYMVENEPFKLFIENIILSKESKQYRLEVTPNLGHITSEYWEFTPQLEHHKQTVTCSVTAKNGKIFKQTTQLSVAPKTQSKNSHQTLLIIGDSLTAAGKYPTEIATLLAADKNSSIKMVGSQTKDNIAYYEGYGGWTWHAFMSKSQKIIHETDEFLSPFVTKNGPDEFTLDFEQYFKKECNGTPPDIITILLGINDCFLLQNKLPNRQKIEQGINHVLDKAEQFLSALQNAAPNTKIGLCLTPVSNNRESAFINNYKAENLHCWPWRQVQHLHVQAQIKRFSNRESENIYIIPTNVTVDTSAGYPNDNAVHANDLGYSQLAKPIYNWIKNITSNA